MNWLSRMFSDAAGIPDDGRIAAFFVVVSYIALSWWNVAIEHHAFDYVQFGIGIGGVFTGVGAFFNWRGKN